MSDNKTAKLMAENPPPLPDFQARCEMSNDCNGSVAYMDNQGFLYCESHGISRKNWKPCRKLRPAEIKALLQAQRPKKY